MSGTQAVIVTGASSGIGLGIALKYLSEGHDVILVGRNIEKLRGAIPTDFKGPGRSLFLAKDVSTLEGCKELIKEGIEMLGGRLDVLVNNAGAGKFDLKLADITPEDWLWHMNTNVNSVMYLTQMAIPHLEATKGNVVNISSIAAKRAVPGAPAYAISKAAVDALTTNSALELAPRGIRVNAINPATVVTNFFTSAGMSEDQAQAYMSKSAKTHPIGRVGTPADIAELCYFLTDNSKAGWITGQCIVADGGRILSMPTLLGQQSE
ncbi:g7687 [Coccomyxa viridis]|uniref:G7687 protein n=1 Tax=Coccomyxa viridis TaxID=1274662 RepID=A0ABP1FZM3_9CHLO